jgi:probable aminopeptidase NPEPL1
VTIKTFTGVSSPAEIWVSILPTKVCRHVSANRKEWIFQQAQGIKSEDRKAAILVLDEADHYEGALAALARHEQITDYTSSKDRRQIGKVAVVALTPRGELIKPNTRIKAVAKNVAWVSALVDKTPADLNPASYAKEIREVFKDFPQVKVTEIAGEKLVKSGLMGIHGVGRAAVEEPRMLVLEYKPKGATKTVGLIGKGITFDTGGLSLKPSSSMVSMKTDMGGSGAVLGAFRVLVECQSDKHLVCCVALAENAIGPNAYRVDDVLTMYSGKTVEINNTDAEGRLLLADCLAYVGKNYSPDLLIDAATLTGAQIVSTGVYHAALVCNDDGLEKLAYDCGMQTGDMAMPLIFAPDMLFDEFASTVADMRNSLKSKNTAQSSAAGVFLFQHLSDPDKPWLHIDLAGPAATANTRKGTGFGVSLISAIVERF